MIIFKPVARIGVMRHGRYLFRIDGVMIANKLLGTENIEIDLEVFSVYVAYSPCGKVCFSLFEMPFLKLKSKFSTIHQSIIEVGVKRTHILYHLP